MGCCIGDCCICDSDAIERKPDSDGGKPTADVDDELEKMKTRAAADAAKDEADINTDIAKNFNSLLEELKKINMTEYNGRKLNINISRIKKKNEKLLSEVNGFIADHMRNRLDQKDKELNVILNEMDSGKRKKNFEDFYKRIHREAKQALEKRIRETGNDQKEIIEEAIKQRREEVNSGLDRIENEYKDLLAAHENGRRTVLQLKIDYMYRLDVTNIAMEQVKESKRYCEWMQ